MKYFTVINLLCLFFLTRSQAQITIDAVSTDTIDLFKQQHPTEKKYGKLPLWSTLLVPGSGHQLIGRPKSALGYISTDVVSLFGAIFFNRYGKKMIDNSRVYASLYAGVTVSANDELYWQAVGNFNDYYDFHRNMKLVRDSDKLYSDQSYFWSWEDEAFRKEFFSMQKFAKQLSTVSSFFIGAMVLNRIIAFIDLRSIMKNSRYSNNGDIYFRPYTTDRSSSGLIVSAAF
ncbi:MAG: hypothetical protein JXA18_07030 [Chitinispirillaceae bacterium]|nr:hypothetical protein [Chitinispirillaceae bacterium]